MAQRSNRIRLRSLDLDDAEFVRSLYAHELVTRALAHITGPISLEEALAFCEAPPREHRFGAALQTDGSLIGVGSIREQADQPGVVVIGYSILPAFWNQGFGAELASLLIDYATDGLNTHEFRATTRDDNPASARVLGKLGFCVLEADAPEVDSRGLEQSVTRWTFESHRP